MYNANMRLCKSCKILCKFVNQLMPKMRYLKLKIVKISERCNMGVPPQTTYGFWGLWVTPLVFTLF